MGKWLAGIVAAVIAGLVVWQLTEGLGGDENPSSGGGNSTPPRSFLERIAGSYELESWTRQSGPIDLGVSAITGTLTVSGSGDAHWELALRDDGRGRRTQPRSRIKCRGRIIVDSQSLEGVPGSGNETIDWDSNLMSLSDDVWLTFGGWATMKPPDPFSLALDERSSGGVVLQMRNSRGTFTWTR